MSQKASLFTGLALAAFAAAIAFEAPALAGDRCTVDDPSGAGPEIHDLRKNVVGTVENGSLLVIQRYGEDDAGKPWAYVMTTGGERLGWVYRSFIRCS